MMGVFAHARAFTTMNDLEYRFQNAVAASKELTQRPDNATLLKLYALYKQATEGDVNSAKPGFGDLVGRAKWDAWAALKGVDGNTARERYIELVDGLE
jgi:acyl-CoA-binding protein